MQKEETFAHLMDEQVHRRTTDDQKGGKKTTSPHSTAFEVEWFIKSTFSSSEPHQVSSENL